MLKKLFLYDFRAIAKIMWILTVIVAVVTCVSCLAVTLLWNLDYEGDSPFLVAATVLSGTVVVAGYIAISAYCVVSFIVIVSRFYKNLFTDEGYLTFTLPVKVSEIYNAKLLAGLAWSAIAAAVTFVCFFALMIFSVSLENIAVITSSLVFSFKEVFKVVPIGHFIAVLAEALLMSLVTALFQLVFLYLCVTLGSIIVKKAKIVVSLLIYFLTSTVVSGIASVISTIVVLVVTGVYGDALGMGTVEGATSFMLAQLHTQLIVNILVYGGVGIGMYCWNRKLLAESLNLA